MSVRPGAPGGLLKSKVIRMPFFWYTVAVGHPAGAVAGPARSPNGSELCRWLVEGAAWLPAASPARGSCGPRPA